MLTKSFIKPIQDEERGGGGGAKRPTFQFFPYNFYKRRN